MKTIFSLRELPKFKNKALWKRLPASLLMAFAGITGLFLSPGMAFSQCDNVFQFTFTPSSASTNPIDVKLLSGTLQGTTVTFNAPLTGGTQTLGSIGASVSGTAPLGSWACPSPAVLQSVVITQANGCKFTYNCSKQAHWASVAMVSTIKMPTNSSAADGYMNFIVPANGWYKADTDNTSVISGCSTSSTQNGATPITVSRTGLGTAQYHNYYAGTTSDASTWFGAVFDATQLPPAVPLSVNLSYFTASVTADCKVNVNWKSTVETLFSHYEIEYSADGEHFAKALSVDGKGRESIYHQVVGVDAKDVISYFRLKMIDLDGKSTYSQVASVRNACKEQMAISINPNVVYGSEFKLSFDNRAGDYAITMINALGAQVYYNRVNVGVIHQNLVIDRSNLAKGFYNVVVRNLNTQELKTIKVILQ